MSHAAKAKIRSIFKVERERRVLFARSIPSGDMIGLPRKSKIIGGRHF
jgi:hypothetical protein